MIRIAAGLEIEPDDLFEGIRWRSGVGPVSADEGADPREFAVEVRSRLSSNLHELRTRCGHSEDALARLAGLDPAGSRAYEHGIAMPGIADFIRLCGALGVTPDELVAGIRWVPKFSGLAPGSFVVVGDDALDAEISALMAAVDRRRGEER
ncbi:MAG: helix-turn-helix transcriptional regulator [Solirubrobacterales bacterium]